AFASPAFASGVSDVTATNGAPTNAAGGQTNYIVKFRTATLLAGTDARIHLAFPTGTTFPGWGGGTVAVGGTTIGGCYGPSGVTVRCWLNTSTTVPESTKITVAFDGVTNPGSAGTFSAYTTSDPAAQSTRVTVAANQTITGLTVDNSVPTSAAGARTRYVASF